MDSEPRLMDQVRHAVRLRHYSFATEKAYVQWIRRFIIANGKRHPRDLGAAEVEKFLTDLAVKGHVSPSTQNQALSAILFLYKRVLGVDLEWLQNVVRAKRDRKIPVVFTQKEARKVVAHLADKYWLMGSLMYGAGLRVMETLRLRVKDIDLNYHEIVVHDGKGRKDRRTLLPDCITERLDEHLVRVRCLYQNDIDAGNAGVSLPYALARKYPRAGNDWGWQYVFPSANLSKSPYTGNLERHHADEKGIQRAVHLAVRTAGIQNPRPVILSAIPLRRTCSNQDTTSARFRNCWATAM